MSIVQASVQGGRKTRYKLVGILYVGLCVFLFFFARQLTSICIRFNVKYNAILRFNLNLSIASYHAESNTRFYSMKISYYNNIYLL